MQTFTLEGPDGALCADLEHPADAACLLVLAHGAGAGYRHAILTGLSAALAERQVATLRFNFPFMQAGKRRVDARAVAMAVVAEAVRAAARRAPGLPVFAGGHSFGGRMTSHAAAEGLIEPEGLVFLSFPLHPAQRPSVHRAAHLPDIQAPMLFLSGTRDALADAGLLEQVVAGLGPRAHLHWLEDADHGYRVRKTVRREPRPVLEEMADETAAFLAGCCRQQA